MFEQGQIVIYSGKMFYVAEVLGNRLKIHLIADVKEWQIVNQDAVTIPKFK